jgi:hypothetical protein
MPPELARIDGAITLPGPRAPAPRKPPEALAPPPQPVTLPVSEHREREGFRHAFRCGCWPVMVRIIWWLLRTR